MHERLVGKMGRVSDVIPAGGDRRGEVMIDGQAYYATDVDHQAVAKGTRVVVVEHYPPRTVVVTPM